MKTKVSDIIMGNEIIAKFMNLRTTREYGSDGRTLYLFEIGNKEDVYEPVEMEFHSSWDWLMMARRRIIEMLEDVTTMPSFEITSHHIHLWININDRKSKWTVGCYAKSPEDFVVLEAIKYINKTKKP